MRIIDTAAAGAATRALGGAINHRTATTAAKSVILVPTVKLMGGNSRKAHMFRRHGAENGDILQAIFAGQNNICFALIYQEKVIRRRNQSAAKADR